ncbi:MAG: hypothetical protein KUG75_13940 [Pseudomonadales bacterium]|nr:hypothetical protein [Pseudomonadales bacterium]
MTTRRSLIKLTGLAGLTTGLHYNPSLAKRAFGTPILSELVASALKKSPLVYLTPIRSDGRESSCQSEVWFVWDDNDLLIVTASKSWRARAITNGLSRTRMWVGDEGVWSDNQGAYRNLPGFYAEASIDKSARGHAQVLKAMGDKYYVQWLVWQSRFENGLADGTRVLLRYRPAAEFTSLN